ncbi:MAG: FAD synthase [Candidatus Curtissbacteria bacterium]|nr:FAD synthase [Candidatus Curtissbacteria bacterium]
MKRVMVFGAFDGLHPGHINFFNQAIKHGDYLIVSVGTDKNVFKIKGKKPLFSQNERLSLVENVALVDKAVLGAEEDFYGELKKYEPDFICLGYDQWASEEEVSHGLKKAGLLKTKVVRLKPYKETKAKSTHLKKRSVDF